MRFTFLGGFLFGLAILVPSVLLRAQKNYYLTIQSSDSSRFYVRDGGQFYCSSKAGFMIIPGRDSGDHRLQITGKDSLEREQVFLLPNLERNRFLLLKQKPSQNWVLQDLRDSGIVYVSNKGKSTLKQQEAFEPSSPDAFGDLLSRVTKDSTVANVGTPLREVRKKKTKQQREMKSVIRLKDKQIRAAVYEYVFEVENGMDLDTIQIIIDRRD
jgi:hypothetical protein